MKPLYSIVITVYNKLDLTKKCIESILSTDVSQAEIIVVDNASEDGTHEYLESLGSTIAAIITLEKNVGVQAYNEAIPHARGTYLVTLNNDMTVSGDWLAQMREPFLKDPKMAIVGARVAPCYLNEAGHGGKPVEDGEPDYVECSCAMMITGLVRRHGLFDPEFKFAYCEDSDLSLRMRKLGYHIASVNAPVVHLGTMTVPLAITNGFDVWGFHDLNHLRLTTKWAGYLKTRSFKEVIVIKRQMALGDVLQVTPVIRKLKEENAHREIHVWTDHADVFKNNPDVASAHGEFRANFPQGARFINLDQCYEKTPKRPIVESYAEAAGVKITDPFPRIYPTREDYDSVHNSGLKIAVIHTGPHRGNNPVEGRTLTDELELKILGYLNLKGFGIYILEKGVTWPLGRLAAIIGKASLFVGADSGPMHIAQAMMTPTVGIFGSVNPDYRLIKVPFFEAVTPRQKEVGCIGCHHEQPAPHCDCTCIRTGDNFNRCMKMIHPEDVFRAIDAVLEGKKMYHETRKIKALVLPHLVGKGIDVGCQRDPITPDCVAYDKNPMPEVTHVGDARQLPFAAGEFDWLWSSHCLEDIADTVATLTEWLRVIRPGGTIGIYVPHPDLYKGYNADHIHAGFKAEELIEYLTGLGCEIIAAVNHDINNPKCPCHSTLVLARKK